MSTVAHAVIAVAGLGSRLGRGMPKCLVEVAGRTIIQHQLELLKEVPDVRVVVGYMEHEVIQRALAIRDDLTIVRNPDYRATTTQRSYWLGARFLTRPCLYLDGDIIFDERSFNDFMQAAASRDRPLVGITEVKTSHPVFASTLGADRPSSLQVGSFSRSQHSTWEWANLAYLPPGMLEKDGGDVFKRLEGFLPLDAKSIHCFEVDTEDDLRQAEYFASRFEH